MRKLVEKFLNRIVKVELQGGSVSVGELTSAEETLLEITHRDGLKSIISYGCISQIVELPRR